MTRPRPTTTRWSAVSCSSLIRWLDTSTARPCRGQRPQEAAHPDDALGVHAVERLVQHQHRRVAEQRRGDPEPLPHAERVAARLAPGRRLQAGLLDHLIDPLGGQALRMGQPQQVVAGAAAGLQRGRVQQRPDLAQRVPQARGTAGRRPARCPSSAASRPRITRIVVDLPAPLGPTNPVTWPGRTVKDIPSSARVGPNRLRRPATSIVASMPGRLGKRGRRSRHAAERSCPPLHRGRPGRASPTRGTPG